MKGVLVKKEGGKIIGETKLDFAIYFCWAAKNITILQSTCMISSVIKVLFHSDR